MVGRSTNAAASRDMRYPTVRLFSRVVPMPSTESNISGGLYVRLYVSSEFVSVGCPMGLHACDVL